MFERFSTTARRTVILAQEEARMLNHDYVGTEHLLLALVSDEGHASNVLEALGLTSETARTTVTEIIGVGLSAASGHIPFTPRARLILENSLRVALDYRDNYIGLEHILHALLADEESVAGQILVRSGVHQEAVRQRLMEIMTAPADASEKPEEPFALSA